MTTYDTPAPADPFARSRICSGFLAEDLAGGRAGEMTHDQLEELVSTRGRERERQLLQDHLDLRAVREEQALPAQGQARRAAGRSRAGRGRGRGLATVVGPVTVRRLAFRARAGSTWTRPMPRCRCLRHSHGVARLAAREAVRGSCDTARAAIGRRCGHVAGKRQREELVRSAARGTGALCAQRVPVPCTSEVLLVHGTGRQGHRDAP